MMSGFHTFIIYCYSCFVKRLFVVHIDLYKHNIDANSYTMYDNRISGEVLENDAVKIKSKTKTY